MDTAETPLEDPRLTTSKYILSNENGLTRLSTVNGRLVNLAPVNKNSWKLENVSIPNALIQPPSENQVIKDLYMDIDEPQNFAAEAKHTNVPGKHLPNDKECRNINHEDIVDKTAVTTKINDNIGVTTQGCLTGYKIPKRKNCEQETECNTPVKKRLQVIENDPQNLSSDRNTLTFPNVEKHDNINNSVDNKDCAVFENSINICDNQRVYSTREIVEGDLELSDETCDNTELQKTANHSINEEKRNPCDKNNLTYQSDLRDTSNFSAIQDGHFGQTESNYFLKSNPNYQDKELTVEVEKLSPNEKIDPNTKLKSKKKVNKYKELEHEEEINKKVKSKKDTSREVKSKFNDLFGDSNSLITPDDLGISTTRVKTASQLADIYVPIFEDAQDATDLEQTTNIQPTLVPKAKDVGEVNTSVGNDNGNLESNTNEINVISKVIPEGTNYDIQLGNESKTIVNTIHDKLKIENINTKDDIVKTIVISSGSQPDVNNTESLVNAEELLSENIELDRIDTTHKTQDVLIKALATSTPHKQTVNQIALEINSKLPDSNLSSNNILMSAETCVPTTNNNLEPNEDIPDVRIFVKRRRRVVKNAK